MSNKDLPKWLQHHTGMIQDPTPEEIEADRREHFRDGESFDTWYDRIGYRQHAALMEHYGAMSPSGTPAGAINWALLHAIIPYLAAGVAWLMWLVFLLLPTVFNFDYAGVFPAVSNYAYTAMGLTLCLAATTAAWVAHGVRAIAFTFAVLLLSYWIY